MLHLSHPSDEVAVQVLAFLQTVLYLGNESAQAKIGRMCSHKDTKFFQRIHKMLDIVVSKFGLPRFQKTSTKGCHYSRGLLTLVVIKKLLPFLQDELDDMYSLESFNWVIISNPE